MSTPGQWQQRILGMWQRKGWVSNLLLPLSWLYGGIVAWRRRNQAQRPTPTGLPPIVVVGNLVVGGTGKTPCVTALAHYLRAQGWQPGLISRGYGVNIDAGPRVGHGTLPAGQFGDEPALLAATTQCPIAVHPKRLAAIHALLQAYPNVDVIVSDDGLQHLALPRDLTIIVQDQRGIGNGRLLPAGPLRESVHRLHSAHTLITNLTAQAPDTPAPPLPFPITAQAVTMRLQPVSATRLADGKVLDWPAWLSTYAHHTMDALAAIGQPQRFFAMLQQQGLTLGDTHSLPDHAKIDPALLANLHAALVLVTDKDAIKLTPCTDTRLWSVQVAPVFSDPSWLNNVHRDLKAHQR